MRSPSPLLTCHSHLTRSPTCKAKLLSGQLIHVLGPQSGIKAGHIVGVSFPRIAAWPGVSISYKIIKSVCELVE
jgi:hypothetical protein